MKKSIISLCMTIVLTIFTVSSLAESVKEITFQNIYWYETFPVVHSQLSDAATEWEPRIKSGIEVIGFARAHMSIDKRYPNRGNESGIEAIYYSVPVAGYIANGVVVDYIYALDQNGYVLRDDSQSEFISAIYYIDKYGKEDTTLKEIYDDLAMKLTILYGEPDEMYADMEDAIGWSDTKGAMIQMNYGVQGSVTLGYLAPNAIERIDAINAQITAEALEAEALQAAALEQAEKDAKWAESDQNLDGL